ncbi:MAG: transposase family protein [Solirubrobacterales bacterium]|nr:transposase family protein [Solirubrobacterales bacterium]
MKRPEEAMEILEAYDLTGSLRAAAALAGCDHKTVARLVAAREAAGGGVSGRAARPALVMVEPFAGKVAELVEDSHARIRADKAHGVLVAIGYEGSYRTTRRAVAEAKRRWRQKHGRRTRPWIPQPGKWLQWDYGDGPEVAGVRAVLFCAWLAWSRYRVVVPLRDKTMPSVVIGLDRTLRYLDGCPTYCLTDNEKTVTVEHVCGIAVRNPTIVEVSRYYGLTIATCEPADPQSKGGSEATVKIAKADLVPTDHNLRDQYADWQALERACQEFMAEVNARPHRATRQPPLVLLAEEHEHLHRVPRLPHTLCFGQTRKVDRQATISVGDAIYSVPHELIGERVWVRAEGEQLVVVHVDALAGPREVARHQLTTPGRPSIDDQHYPPRPAGPLERKPRARSAEEREFLASGEGAERWLKRAAAEGTQRIRRKMAEAVDLAKLHGQGPVNEALERCASYGRFADGDLASILHHHQQATVIQLPLRAPEERSLQASTRSWEGFGR